MGMFMLKVLTCTLCHTYIIYSWEIFFENDVMQQWSNIGTVILPFQWWDIINIIVVCVVPWHLFSCYDVDISIVVSFGQFDGNH